VRVVLVEDHPMLRIGLTATLDLADALAAVACAATAQDAGPLVAEHQSDLVVLDILMLTSYDDDASIHAALRAGARGYVVKPPIPTTSCAPDAQRLLRAQPEDDPQQRLHHHDEDRSVRAEAVAKARAAGLS
jgi:DNA-binding NarL/FixJ family response regulator